MKLKLQLVREGEVLFKMPLSPTDWPKDQRENELEAAEGGFERFSKIFDAFSNVTSRGRRPHNKLCRFHEGPKFESQNCLGKHQKTQIRGTLRKGRQGNISLFRFWSEKIHSDKLRI